MNRVEVSIVVPCRNEESTLDLLMKSLRFSCGSQTGVEIIVVDDGSSDATRAIFANWSGRWQVIRLIELSGHVGPARAKNVGIQNARGEYLAFVDADSIVDEKCIERLLTIARGCMEGIMVGGRILPLFEPSQMYEWAMSRAVRHKPRRDSDGTILDLPGGFQVFRKSDLQTLGGFNERIRIGEDSDIAYRARQRGITLQLDCELIVYHRLPKGVSKLISSQFGYGWAFSQFIRRTRECSAYRELTGRSLFASIWWQLLAIPFIVSLYYFPAVAPCLAIAWLLGVVRVLLMGYQACDCESSAKVILVSVLLTIRMWSYQVGFCLGWLFGARAAYEELT